MKSFKQYLIPSIIASICMSTYAIIDGIFIGAKLGDIGLSAINIAWPITAILQSLGMAIGISGGIYISRLKAVDNIEASNKMKLTTIIILALVGIMLGGILLLLREPLLIAFQAKGDTLKLANEYITIILFGSIFQVLGCGLTPLLKNSGKVNYALAASLTSIVTNLILDYILIYVYDYGLEGAAVASVIAQGAAFVVCIIPYFKELKGTYFTKNSMRELLLGACAPFILNYSYSIIIIITNALCMEYGGDAAVAAYTVLSYILYIINAAAAGVADSIQPLFSYNYEKKEYKIVNKMLLNCSIISFILCGLIVGIFILTMKPIINLYNLSDIASNYFYDAMPFYFSSFLLISLSKVVCSYLYSTNKKRQANILTLIEPILLTPLIYLIFMGLKLNGLWIGYLIIQIILLIISFVMLYYTKRKEA